MVKVSLMLFDGGTTKFCAHANSSFILFIKSISFIKKALVVSDPNFVSELLFVARDAQRVFKRVNLVKYRRWIFGFTRLMMIFKFGVKIRV